MKDLEIFLITNRNLVKNDDEYFQRIKTSIEGGVSNIIFREKNLCHEKQRFYYREILKFTKGYNCSLIVNSNIKLYKEEKAEYIHLPFKKFLNYKKYNGEKVGVSIHDIEEAVKANKLGASYLLASNIYETKCKEGLKGKGIEFLKDIKNKVNCKVIALGGINENNVDEIYKAGIKDIAFMSLLMENENPKMVMEKIIESKKV